MGKWFTKEYGGTKGIPTQDAQKHFGRGKSKPATCYPMGKPWWS